MSINISLSSKSTGLCDEIIYRFMKADIDAKFIKTTSVSVKNIEYGCDIIISKYEYITFLGYLRVYNTKLEPRNETIYKMLENRHFDEIMI